MNLKKYFTKAYWKIDDWTMVLLGTWPLWVSILMLIIVIIVQTCTRKV